MCCSVTLVITIRYHVKEWQVLALVIGSVMLFRGTNNTLVGIQDATIVSELIVHVILVSGCVVLVMFVMFWRSRSMVTESVQSALEVEVKVEVSRITFYCIFCLVNHMTSRCHQKADILLYNLINFIFIKVFCVKDITLCCIQSFGNDSTFISNLFLVNQSCVEFYMHVPQICIQSFEVSPFKLMAKIPFVKEVVSYGYTRLVLVLSKD